MESYDILVIILAVTLGILLVLSIIAMVFTIKVLRQLKRITERAEHFAHNIEDVSEFFKKSAGPVAITKLLSNIIETMRDKKGKHKDE